MRGKYSHSISSGSWQVIQRGEEFTSSESLRSSVFVELQEKPVPESVKPYILTLINKSASGSTPGNPFRG